MQTSLPRRWWLMSWALSACTIDNVTFQPPVCEADLMTDSSSCGRCGHDCLGGSCMAGVCQPVPLVTDQTYPGAIGTDGTYVFWTTFGTISPYNDATLNRMRVDGSERVVLQVDTKLGGLALDGDDLYYVGDTQRAVRRIPKTAAPNASPVTIVTGLVDVYLGLAVDATNVYACSLDDIDYNGRTGSVYRAPKTGTDQTATVVASGQQGAFSLAVDDQRLFWIAHGTNGAQYADGSVWSIDKTETSLTQSPHPIGTSLPGLWAIASDGNNAYYTATGNESTSDYSAGALYQTRSEGGQSQRVAEPEGPTAIWIDSTGVYWGILGVGLNHGAIRLLPSGSSTPVDVVTGIAGPRAITTDDVSIYFMGPADATIYRLAKP